MRLSISKINLFKSCRRAYYLKYIENLVPVEKPEALEIGKSYHKWIEKLYDADDTEFIDAIGSDFSKEFAMARAYMQYVYPFVRIEKTEQWTEYDLAGGDKLVGIVDGITFAGDLVEHKTTSGEITEAYEYDLQWNEQILAYMLATGKRSMIYTVIRKPTIRQKKNESDEEFFFRMLQWYDEDTEHKIRYFVVTRTDEEIESFRQDLEKICDEIKHANYYYRNCGECNHWGRRCGYSSICLNYDPNENYIEFERRVDYGDGNN